MLGRLDDAVRNFEQASTLAPENVNALTNLGNTLSMLGRVEEALQSFKRAQDVVPGHAEAHFAESLCRLSVGDFERGWHQYEWRWKLRAARRDLTQPLWLGDTEIAGRTILLHAEQGLGDTLQFCRYATLIAAETKVVIEVPKPLVRLLSTLPGVSHVVACGDPLPEFDLHCPLLSLPLALGTTVATVPKSNTLPLSRSCPGRGMATTCRRPAGDSGLVLFGQVHHALKFPSCTRLIAAARPNLNSSRLSANCRASAWCHCRKATVPHRPGGRHRSWQLPIGQKI